MGAGQGTNKSYKLIGSHKVGFESVVSQFDDLYKNDIDLNS